MADDYSLDYTVPDWEQAAADYGYYTDYGTPTDTTITPSNDPSFISQAASWLGTTYDSAANALKSNPGLTNALINAGVAGYGVYTSQRNAALASNAATNALAFQQQQYADTLARQQPFYSAGVGALNQLTAGIQPGGIYTAAGMPTAPITATTYLPGSAAERNARAAAANYQATSAPQTALTRDQMNALNVGLGGTSSAAQQDLMLQATNLAHQTLGRDLTTDEISAIKGQIESNATKGISATQTLQNLASQAAASPEGRAYQQTTARAASYDPALTFNTALPTFQGVTSNSVQAYRDLQNALANQPNLNMAMFDPSQINLQEDPSYRFRRQEALDAVAAQSAAQGIYGSGNMANALMSRAGDLASQEYQNVYNRAQQTYGTNVQTQRANYNDTVNMLVQRYGMDLNKANAVASAMQADTSLNLQNAVAQYNAQMGGIQYQNQLIQQQMSNQNAAAQQDYQNQMNRLAAQQGLQSQLAGYGTGAANVLTQAGQNAANATGNLLTAQANAGIMGNVGTYNALTGAASNITKGLA